MKFILILAAVAAAAVARPQEPSKPGTVPILDFQLTRDDHGQYSLSYVTGDGTKVTEQGALVENANKTGHVLIKEGSYSYFAPDGTPIKGTWIADVNGFRAEGDHLPKDVTPIAPVS